MAQEYSEIAKPLALPVDHSPEEKQLFVLRSIDKNLRFLVYLENEHVKKVSELALQVKHLDKEMTELRNDLAKRKTI